MWKYSKNSIVWLRRLGVVEETMDKKPHYKQSGIVFLMIGIIFLINVAEMILETGWLFYLVIVVAIIVIAYAIISSVAIARRKK